jgi:hypothetical protein
MLERVSMGKTDRFAHTEILAKEISQGSKNP